MTNPDDTSQPNLLFEAIHFPHAEETPEPQLPGPYMYWVLVTHLSTIPFLDEKSWHIISQEAANLARQFTKS